MNSTPRHRRPAPVAVAAAGGALVLIFALVIGLGAHALQGQANQRLLDRSVQERVQRAALQLAQLQLNVEHGLRGARSVLIAAGGLKEMGADSFSSYQLSADLAREFPGVKGFGLVRLIPWGPGGGSRMLVQFVEPVDRNTDLQGMDLAAHPEVRAVAVSALASGAIQLAGLETGGRLQLLALMALRLPGGADEGWAAAAMKVPDLVAALGLPAGQLALRVQQQTGSSDTVAAERAAASLQDLTPMPTGCVAEARTEHTMFDRRWVLTMCAQQAYLDHLKAPSPLLMGLAGAAAAGVFAGLLAALGVAYRRGRERRTAQMRLEAFVAQAGDAVVATNSEGRITAWNPAAAACFGWPAEDAMGQPLAALLLVPPDLQTHARLLSRVLAGEQVVSHEMQARHRDGPRLDLAVSQAALRADDGTVEGVAYTFVDITARKAQQREAQSHSQRLETLVSERTAALEAARHELQSLIDAMPSLVSYFDLSLTCQFANQAHREWLGLDPASLPGRKLEELVDAATLELIGPYVQDARAGIARRLYRDFPRADGTGTRRALAHYQPLLKLGQVCGVFMLIHDVDELHRSQQALAVEQEKLFNIVRSTDAGTWEWDIDQGRVTVNQRYQVITGRPAQDFNVEPLARRFDVIHPEDAPVMRERIAAHLRGETELFEMECRILHGDGHWVWVRDTGRVSDRDENGRALRVYGTTLDISQRKRAEQQVQDDERRFRFFSDNVAEGIMVAEHGVIVDLSEVMARMLRCPASDAIGKSPQQFMAAALPTGAETFEAWLLRSDGSTFPAQVRSRDVPLGERTVRLTTVLDISRQKQAEAALLQARADAERASLAKSQFLANISHEIRTPLNAVIGLSYLFQDTALDSAQRTLVGKIQLAGRALLSLINDVLDLSKIEAGEMVLDDRDFELPEVLGDVVRLLSGQAEAKGLALKLQVGSDLARPVRGDEQRLRQILLNLVGNAIKFTDSGSVTLSATQTDSAAPGGTEAGDGMLGMRFEVRDTGIGIGSEALPRLFTAFTQADSTNARRFGGTGLGLSIVRQLAEMMGGQVGAHSRLGEGSCFWVNLKLPLAKDTDRRSGTAALSVLLAEDDAAQREQIAHMSRGLGWQVETVRDGPALVQRVTELQQAQQAPDALLVDWKMPGLDGLSALAQLQSSLGAAGMPPAVMLSSSEPADVLAAPHAQLADAVLTKPVSASTLFNAINSAVVRQQGSHERLLLSTRMDSSGTQWLPGVRVLVVDDSDINLEVARHLLERQGATVYTATNGKLGVELLLNQGVDAVLMDVQMPVMDGNEATRRLRREPHLQGLPIIALTAGALLAERQRALDAGMTDFLTKPLDPDQLVRTLRRHIERAQSKPLEVRAVGEPSLAQTPEPATSPWPQIAGIDAEEAQTRLGHDQNLLLRLLKRLLAEFRHAAQAPAEGWDHEFDRAALAARMHKLRGASGMVAAGSVHRLAGEAELAAQQSDTGPALAQLMPALDRALRDLETHARPWLDRAQAQAGAGSGAESEQPGAAQLNPAEVNELRERLKRSDLAALELARNLDGALRASMGEVRHAQWRELIDALDFRQAEPLLQGLAQPEASEAAALQH